MIQLSILTLSICLVFMVILSGFFSGSEIGMMALNRYRLKHLVKQNHTQAKRVNALLSNPTKLLSVILIGNTITNIVASVTATLIGQRLYGDIGVAVATAILTTVILVFSEMMPKTLAALYAQKVAFICAVPLSFLQKVLAPVVGLVSFIVNFLLRMLGFKPQTAKKDVLSQDELRSVVHEASVLMPTEHKSMLVGLMDLEHAYVEDIMIPKADIVGIDLEQPWHDILYQLETTLYNRIPVYRNGIDSLIGMVHVRSILHLVLDDASFNEDKLLEIIESPYFIPEATPLNAQIINFKKMKQRSAFVVDEYGELQGLVTLDDILEEIVGEFTTDMAELSQDVMIQKDGSFLVDASVSLRHLSRMLKWEFPMIGPRTLSGLIIEYLGYIPAAASCVKINEFQFEIIKVSENMIRSVNIVKVKTHKNN